ncbi:ABC transporter permease [soil metagenome]
MNDMSLALDQVRYTNKAFWRNPASAFFTIAFPLLFLVLFTTIFGGGSARIEGQEISTATFTIPSISVFSVITATYTNIAISVAFARDGGVLKRLRGTPMPPWTYMFGRIVHATLIAILLVAVTVAFGGVFYGIPVPTDNMPAFLVTLALGAACFCALGLAVTTIIPNADASPAIVNATILPLLFISNVFIPLDNPPEWLDGLSKIFPVRHFADAALASFLALPHQAVWRAGDLAVMAAWALAGLLIAVRFFAWEPRR